MLECAGELLREGGVDALSTRSLAERSGVPVGTIYRYFQNRDAILDAYLDRDLEQIEASIVAALLATERVTFRSMIEAFAYGHRRYHEAHPQSIPVWFGGRLNPVVAKKVSELDARHARSLATAATETGMAVGAPWFISELLVRLFDRAFEFTYSHELPPREQDRVLAAMTDMASLHMERYATPRGLEGVPSREFVDVFESAHIRT